MLEFFIKRPVTTIMFVLFWVALGVTAFPRMNIELRPDMDFPMITATFVHPGASADEIETQIIRRAEEAISEVAGLNRISSQVFENGGFVFAEFHIGVNINDIASEITGKIDALANDFPDGMQRPVVQKLDVLQEPVVDIVMSGESPIRIEQFVRDVLSGQITAMPGVASVSVFGGRERAVRVEVNPELIMARGATITDVVGALQQNNINMPGGRIESGWSSHNVRFVGEFDTIADVENVIITTSEGANFMLRDVAVVRDYMRDAETGARFNGAEVVMASVVRANDGNAIQISNAIERNFERWETLAQNYFGAGTEFQMMVVRDTSLAIRAETQGTLVAIIIGIFLTVLTLLYFARNVRTTIIASVVIPASLLSGFFFIDFSGFTINAMTLMAMAAALGTLIANAIVLIESALRMMEQGADPEVAAVEGTKKAIVPVMAAAGTNLVVFLPLVFMGGIAGQFMSHFGMTVVWLTILSLMFSFTLTPMMIAKVLRVKKQAKQKKKKDDDELPWFKSWFDFQMKKPGPVILLSFFILIGSSFMMQWVGDEFAPNTDVNEISIIARAPAGTPFDRTVEISEMIESRIREFPEVDFVSARIGDRGTQNIQMSVGLIPREDRRRTDRQLVQLFLPELVDIPGVEIQVSAGPSMGMAGDLTLHITGIDNDIRDAYADKIMAMINAMPEIQSVIPSAQAPGTEIRFIPNPVQMRYWGVNNAAAANAMRTALFGNDTLRFREGGHEHPIIIEMDSAYQTRDMFNSIFVSSPKGLVALSELGTIEYASAVSDIHRVSKQRVTEIGIILGKSTIGPVQAEIEYMLNNMEWTAGYGFNFGGISEIQEEMQAEMMAAFLLATILTYMLLAAILNSFLHPLTIATSILFSFAGVFWMLFLTGASMNIAALLSIIMLVGLTTTNNILVLEPALNKVRAGMDYATALWSEFVDKRRMLFMTTIAVVAGIAPQLFSADGVKSSMGAVIVGGMVASLFWTFAMTPALFVALEKLRARIFGGK